MSMLALRLTSITAFHGQRRGRTLKRTICDNLHDGEKFSMGTDNFLAISGMHSWLFSVVLGPYHDEVKRARGFALFHGKKWSSSPACRLTAGLSSWPTDHISSPRITLAVLSTRISPQMVRLGQVICGGRRGAFLCLFCCHKGSLEVYQSWIGIHCRWWGRQDRFFFSTARF